MDAHYGIHHLPQNCPTGPTRPTSPTSPSRPSTLSNPSSPRWTCAGRFRKDSSLDLFFVWSYSCDKRKTEPFLDERDCIEFCRRDMVNAPPVYPAPTLQEIMQELGKDFFVPTLSMQGAVWQVECEFVDVLDDYRTEIKTIIDSRASTAALKLWLELNPSEVKP